MGIDSQRDFYKSLIEFRNNELTKYSNVRPIDVYVVDISNTDIIDNGCGFKSDHIYYMILSDLDDNNNWHTINEFCLNYKSIQGMKEIYEAYQVFKYNDHKYIKTHKPKVNICFSANRHCKILTFDFLDGSKKEIYTITESSINSTDIFEESKGAPILEIEDFSTSGDYFLAFRNSARNRIAYQRFRAFINYILFHNIKYHAFRIASTAQQIYFSFENDVDRRAFLSQFKVLFPNHYGNEISTRTYPLRFVKDDFKKLRLK